MDGDGVWVTPQLLADGQDRTKTLERVAWALRASVPLLQINQALSSAPRALTSLRVPRERNVWLHGESVFPSIKIPTVGPAEEEPGVLLRQHPALPAPTSAASDKKSL